jgi:nucleoside-diphosphate-sugar epimerase
MRVFVEGATGAVGRRLVPMLVAGGHDVFAMTRSADRARALSAMGAEPVVADGLDGASVITAVRHARPEVVIHQMSALGGTIDLRRFDRDFALTNRLRTEGLDHLIAAARACGVRRVIAQSYGSWNFERSGGPVKTEEDPLDPTPVPAMKQTLDAIRYLEKTLETAGDVEGVAVRYGNLYGPSTAFADDGEITGLVRRRKFPIIGNGAGVWSFTHVDDAAGIAIAAMDRGAPGVYNAGDDEPAPAAVWLPELARVLGVKPPRHVPAWIGRLVAGEAAVSVFTKIRGGSNAKAKRELGWRLVFPSWRQGFRSEISDATGGRGPRAPVR